MDHSRISPWLRVAAQAIALAALLGARPAAAQTYTKLYEYPIDSRNHSGIVTPGLMVQGTDGNLYGTNMDDQTFAQGSAFRMTPSGKYKLVYQFCSATGCSDGVNPPGGLTLGQDGNLYGSTQSGGTKNFGTVFSLTMSGKLTTLYNFTGGADSGYPQYPPFQAADGTLYGAGGEPYAGDYGLIYKMTAKKKAETFSVLTTFTYANGATPNQPVLASDGNFYGTGLNGGDPTCRCGVVYKMTPKHKVTVLHIFKGYPTDGYEPAGAIAQGNDGNFYGTTYAGGAYNQGAIFKITPAGKFTLIHSFHYVGSDLEGKNPLSGLALGSDGNFYGSIAGGQTGYGALYRVTTAGALTLVYSFCPPGSQCADGFGPQTPLVQHTNGKFYGSTAGNSLGGSVFYSLDVGLAPFVRIASPSGSAGRAVNILGQGFRTVRGVSFGGRAARFTVLSDHALVAIVPAGASSGFVRVATANGTLASDRVFAVSR
jgi:uncharacterized repeat protein (TIGR03803 family)